MFNLVNKDLKILSLFSIKNPENLYESFKMLYPTIDENALKIISGKIKKKEVRIDRNDRVGLDIYFKLKFDNNNHIIMILHKKRKQSIMFTTHINTFSEKFNNHILETPFGVEYYDDCDDLLIKYFLHHFDNIFIQYISDGMSNKWKDVKQLILDCHKIQSKYFTFDTFIEEKNQLSHII